MDPLSTARELLPLIRASRDATESQRRIAAPVVEALRASGLCRIALPPDQGGLSATPRGALSIYELLAGADASVSWLVWNNALPGFFGRFLRPEARAIVFANREAIYAGSTRPSG